ncbi:alpha-L-rhamnosidase C-terminal domain-containing protein [Cohnella hashimotonis]|uniref:Alpha-L-rhamnosidase C-terminal domain-containing protein n=1 Tax=Cohnella hashimotonis TaxID=2826895 RepID=A0ABT6TMD3_9BACL|nr:alpha-L-rhamnosidase C-terminal domain-containing protein [Cohnella hashimotonis]
MQTPWEDEASWIWTADWTHEDESGIGKFVYFRKTVELGEGPFNCTLRISADSRYRLFVNGHSICSGPSKGDRFTWYYDSLSIGDRLRPGQNVIAVQVLRYPYAGGGNQSVWRTRLPGLYVHADIRNPSSNEIVHAHTDDSWLCLKDEAIVLTQGVYTQFLGVTESVDGAKLPVGWDNVRFDDTGWQKARSYVFDTKHGELRPWELSERPIPMMYENGRTFQSISKFAGSDEAEEYWANLLSGRGAVFIEPKKSVTVDVDAGELTTGYIELLMSGGQDAAIELLCAECYEQEPILVPWLRDKGDRTDSVNGDLYGDIDLYKPAGEGDESGSKLEKYEPFWFRTFRYVRIKIETKEQPLRLHRLTYRETGYPIDVAAEYRSSDPEESVLWDISVRTLRRCMHETYEDCPYYEQLQYAMDTRSQILFTYCLSGDDRLARKTFYEFHSSLLPQGLTQSRYPSVATQVIPGFSLYWIYMLHDHMMFAGDRKMLERYLPSIDAVLGYFHRTIDASGLVGPMNPRYWSFVDWADKWKDDYGVPDAAKKGPLTVYCLMYAYALRQAAEIADYANRARLASEYRDRASDMIRAVRTHCMSADIPGCFTDGPNVEAYSQHAQIWAILSGAASVEEGRNALLTALDDPSFVPCSFAMSFYQYRALTMVGLYERVHELLAPWRKMAKDGLTTWMEDTVSQRSDAHAWGSVPIYEYAAETLGVHAKAPGFKEIGIRPFIGRLTHAGGRVMTPHGPVDVDWRVDDGYFHISAKWPEHLTCTLVLPNGSSVSVENGGKYETTVEWRQSAAAEGDAQ